MVNLIQQPTVIMAAGNKVSRDRLRSSMNIPWYFAGLFVQNSHGNYRRKGGPGNPGSQG